ncbi:hypothetical protein [Paraburkholderia lycopersici]|uniref:hypothetical protein n=1 Tax=Paraburkholderia lycopersici TaxID=416944 RepID=UPI001161107F|nr:hypothetical protein [Paraburkholderia lycopersici]
MNISENYYYLISRRWINSTTLITYFYWLTEFSRAGKTLEASRLTGEIVTVLQIRQRIFLSVSEAADRSCCYNFPLESGSDQVQRAVRSRAFYAITLLQFALHHANRRQYGGIQPRIRDVATMRVFIF